ncbi:hypothetical protein I5O09_10380 [Pseudomonas parafulva]|uniref:HNH endonuclease n=1 Tax=Pseudomonas parafulva TaxID=157782 RepID=UPI0018D7A4FB|nr:HNH endonuclease [Pseudomonas parafulva]MBH3344152.1 hypothetical protein [Pseudomonas parafulva]
MSHHADNLTIEFMFLGGGFKLGFGTPSQESLAKYNELLQCFYKSDTYKPWVAASKEIKHDLQQFVGKHNKSYPHLNKLQKIIQSIQDDEILLIAGEFPTETSKRHEMEILLEVLNEVDLANVGSEWQKRIAESKDFTKSLLESYDLFTPRTDIRITIGNSRKDNRICRFCGGRLASGSSFSKVAHAIPEALGNKSIVLGDECDECNKYFGDNIEPHLIESFDIYRAFLGVKGKSGTPNLKYTNGEITHKDGIAVVVAKRIEFTENGISVNLGGSRKLTPAKLYRALCKITLSVIGDQELIGLEDTLDWVRNDHPQTQTPKVGITIIRNAPDDSIVSVAVFTRKTEDYSLPHVVTEFRFGSFVYVYILPFSRKDKLKFLSDSEFERFWSSFPMYNQIDSWQYHDLQSTQELSIEDSIKISNRNHISPKQNDNSDDANTADQ